MSVLSVEVLRDEFDRSFAAPPRPPSKGGQTFLSIQLAGASYALNIMDLGGVLVDQNIIKVPSPDAALLGLGSARGDAVGIFDLAILLGAARPQEAPRWVALSPGHDPVGFAFEELEGYLHVESDALAQAAGSPGALVRQVICQDGQHRPVIDMQALMAFVCGDKVQDRER